MDRQNIEVQYRCAKWLITNMMISGKISLDDYEKAHKEILERLNPPLKSVETPGFYIQEIFENE